MSVWTRYAKKTIGHLMGKSLPIMIFLDIVETAHSGKNIPTLAIWDFALTRGAVLR
jgi:hypothetical protein